MKCLYKILFCFCFTIYLFGDDFDSDIGFDNDYALNATDKPKISFSFSPSISYLFGKANEFVYTTSQQMLSRLIWETKSANLAGFSAVLGLDAGNKIYQNINFALNYNKLLGSGDGYMEDYDWKSQESKISGKWDHWSSHPKTIAKNIELLDINIQSNFYKYLDTKYFATLGFKQSKYKWVSYGGKYIYHPNRTVKGTWSNDTKTIDYKQVFKSPYIGAGIFYDKSKYTLKGSVIGSKLATSEAIDNHYQRKDKNGHYLVFEDNVIKGIMIGAKLKATINISQLIQAGAKIDYLDYPNGVSGMDNRIFMFSIFGKIAFK